MSFFSKSNQLGSVQKTIFSLRPSSKTLRVGKGVTIDLRQDERFEFMVRVRVRRLKGR
jgi:hypothetical protein